MIDVLVSELAKRLDGAWHIGGDEDDAEEDVVGDGNDGCPAVAPPTS